MKKMMLCVGVLILVSSFVAKMSINDAKTSINDMPPINEMLTFEGVVLRVGPHPGYLSGILPAYQLVKYRIERIIAGRYEGKEIVVDHLILTGNELEEIKIGDRVCITVRASDEIGIRRNVKGIRKASQVVKIFYIGGKVSLSKREPCINKQ